MKLSKAAGYGIHAVVFIARQDDDKLILAKRIAKHYKLPLESLLKILQQLVRSRVLRSTRGPQGGFRLGQPAHRISLADIIAAADGQIVGRASFDGIGGDAKVKRTVSRLCAKSARQIKNTFKSVTIADLI